MGGASPSQVAVSSLPSIAGLTGATLRVVNTFLAAIASSPFDPRLRVGLADAARASGQPELEADALQSALELDTARGLDPLVQFPLEERSELERRLESLREQSIQ